MERYRAASGDPAAMRELSAANARALPGVPTIAEAMKDDFASTAWQGIVAPAGTPREIIEKLNRVVNSVVKDPAVVQQLADQGVTALGGTSEQYGRFIQKEFERWQHTVKESGAKVE